MYEVIRKIPEVKYYDYLKDKRFVEDDFMIQIICQILAPENLL